jgi:hypothetical protein
MAASPRWDVPAAGKAIEQADGQPRCRPLPACARGDQRVNRHTGERSHGCVITADRAAAAARGRSRPRSRNGRAPAPWPPAVSLPALPLQLATAGGPGPAAAPAAAAGGAAAADASPLLPLLPLLLQRLMWGVNWHLRRRLVEQHHGLGAARRRAALWPRPADVRRGVGHRLVGHTSMGRLIGMLSPWQDMMDHHAVPVGMLHVHTRGARTKVRQCRHPVLSNGIL